MRQYIEYAFQFTLWSSVTALSWGIIFMLFSEKPVQGYYLSSGENNPVVISVDIDNYPDPDIELVGIEYEEAVEMVKELNNNLKGQ